MRLTCKIDPLFSFLNKKLFFDVFDISKIPTKMNKAKLVRKPSPPRAETENTFLSKLEEIRKKRQIEQVDDKKRKLIVNGKEALGIINIKIE